MGDVRELYCWCFLFDNYSRFGDGLTLLVRVHSFDDVHVRRPLVRCRLRQARPLKYLFLSYFYLPLLHIYIMHWNQSLPVVYQSCSWPANIAWPASHSWLVQDQRQLSMRRHIAIQLLFRRTTACLNRDGIILQVSDWKTLTTCRAIHSRRRRTVLVLKRNVSCLFWSSALNVILLWLHPLIESIWLVVIHYHNRYLTNRQLFWTTYLDWRLNSTLVLVFWSV